MMVSDPWAMFAAVEAEMAEFAHALVDAGLDWRSALHRALREYSDRLHVLDMTDDEAERLAVRLRAH